MLTKSPSELFRILQQFDNPFEQATGAAAIDTSMIKAQCDLGFGPGNEFFFVVAPRWNFFANP